MPEERKTVYKAGEQSSSDPFEFVMSSDVVDRMGDIVEQNWNLKFFRRNPIALWGHDSSMPIGVWERVRVEGNKLLGRLKLADKGTSDFIDFLRGLIEQRILKAVSVGFRPGSYKALDEDDPLGGYRLSDNELLECSLCSVPANPEALSLAKSLRDATRSRLFAKPGVTDQSAISAAAQLGVSTSRDSGIPSAPSAANRVNDGNQRTTKMTLSEKITQKKEELVRSKDALTDLVSGEEPMDEATSLQVEELTAGIARLEKELGTLEQAEAALAIRTVSQTPEPQQPAAPVQRAPAAPGLPGGAPLAQPSPGPGVQRIIATVNRPKGYNQMATFAVLLSAHVHHRNPMDIIHAHYPEDAQALEILVKAATAPADVPTAGWAAELVRVSYGEFLDLIRDESVYPSLPGTRAQFDRSGQIIVPRNEGRGQLAGGFLGELKPIPVKAGTLGSTDLTPKKMAVISTYSKELGRQSTPQIQTVITNQILGDTAEALDAHYLGNAARTAVQPAGLQDPTETGAGNINASTGVTIAAINADSKAMISRFLESRSGSQAVWIMNPLRVLGLQTVQDAASGAFPFAAGVAAGTFQNFPFISSQNVPKDVVYLQSNQAMTYGDAFAPMIEANDTSTLIFDDAPLDSITEAINDGTPQTVNSLWQIDGVGIKMTLGMDYRITRGGGSIQVLTGVAW